MTRCNATRAPSALLKILECSTTYDEFWRYFLDVVGWPRLNAAAPIGCLRISLDFVKKGVAVFDKDFLPVEMDMTFIMKRG